MKKPKQLTEIDLQKLRDICQEYIDFVDNDEEYCEGNDFYIYTYMKQLYKPFTAKMFLIL